MADSPPTEADVLRSAVARWRAELRDLQAQGETVTARIEAAERLLSLLPGAGENVVTLRPPDQPTLFSREAPGPTLAPDTPWVEAVKDIIYSAPFGVSFAEMRAVIDNTPGLAERIRLSDSGYYNAISRMQSRKEIFKDNGRLFSPQAYEIYRRDIASGKVIEPPPVAPTSFSPMGEAVLDIVMLNKDGILGKDIVAALRRDPEFNATLTPHNSGAYNVIARLVRRNQILRREDGLCLPGIRFPYPRTPNPKWMPGSEEAAAM